MHMILRDIRSPLRVEVLVPMGAAPRIALMALAMGLTIYLPYFSFDAVAPALIGLLLSSTSVN